MVEARHFEAYEDDEQEYGDQGEEENHEVDQAEGVQAAAEEEIKG